MDRMANEYGTILAEYDGTGSLKSKDLVEIACKFRAFQLRDGHVVVLCETGDTESFWTFPFNMAQALIGTTADGRILKADGLFETNFLPSLQNRGPGAYCAYRADALDVNAHSTEISTISRFTVTNLTLASPELELSHPSAQQIRLQQVNGYTNTVQRLKTIKEIDVTAYLEVRAADIAARTEVADDVCHLLSIARGTKVQWITQVDYLDDNIVVHHQHSSRITKPYCPLPVIDPRYPEDTEQFLAATLPKYPAQKQKWGLATGLIDAYLDAKAESDYLQVRGGKLAVAMEMLKEAYITVACRPKFARPQKDFSELISDLKKTIGDVLGKAGWKESERSIVYRNLRALNRVPFRDHMTDLCAHLDLGLPETDIKLFVQCRDSLVHRGRFYSEIATEEERRLITPHPTATQEYFWLVHVLDRLFLRIVGYRGPYVDWSNLEGPERKGTS